jgi:hypothetical protein
MSPVIFLLFLLIITARSRNNTPTPVMNTDSATVTVVNGYGSGKYRIGDTVNIWPEAIPD